VISALSTISPVLRTCTVNADGDEVGCSRRRKRERFQRGRMEEEGKEGSEEEECGECGGKRS
jgi:hypothetical protein